MINRLWKSLFGPKRDPILEAQLASTRAFLEDGLKGYPDCEECQCYPECRTDCPDHLKCAAQMPEYQDLFPKHFPKRENT